ncbi:MAG: helix-turn-helix transcriptional regulator [Reichenbachiella sp.]|uniref:helix-turn-helix domain-containing protein n=1 Tax=Reichenbachiella sp. TaxID=2184521 RepID=UPI003266EF50
MDVSKAVKNLRKKKGLNQVELAEKAGLTQAYISRLEAGKVEPTLTALTKICSSLGTSLRFLFLVSMEDMDLKSDKKQMYEDIKPILEKLIS